MLKTPANLRAIALPTEHGSWGFLLEPLLLGLLLAPSWLALSFVLAMFSLFLVHQPLKIAVKDRLKGIHSNRSQWAEALSLLYACLAFIFALPLFRHLNNNLYLLFALMFPLMLVQAAYDFRNQSRELFPELAGAVALALAASIILVLANWALWPAIALWILLIARTVPAIIFVRALLRKQKSKATNLPLVYLAHGIAFALVLSLAIADFLPYLSVFAMLILGIRAYLTLNNPMPIAAKIIGFREIGFGLMTVGLTALGYFLGL